MSQQNLSKSQSEEASAVVLEPVKIKESLPSSNSLIESLTTTDSLMPQSNNTESEGKQKSPEEKIESNSEERKFAGLGNQGATCYMNSLLQALFMTPEFRTMIYKWR
jgi:ubiquitin C-terminal hydrolase